MSPGSPWRRPRRCRPRRRRRRMPPARARQPPAASAARPGRCVGYERAKARRSLVRRYPERACALQRGVQPALSREPRVNIQKVPKPCANRRVPRRAAAIAAAAVALCALGPGASAAPAAKKKKDAVRETVQRAFERGSLDAEQRSRYLSSWSAALKARRALSAGRAAEIGYVIDTIKRLARERRLTARLAPLFLMLDRNRAWWTKAGAPASGARLTFGGSRVIFQYFPGKGLQLHPLANFGKLNGYWQGRRNTDLRSLADDLVELAVERNGFLTWEYYFAFGGGSPPWISGMAQGTAMQALARAGNRLADPALTAVAGRARGAFELGTPRGVR